MTQRLEYLCVHRHTYALALHYMFTCSHVHAHDPPCKPIIFCASCRFHCTSRLSFFSQCPTAALSRTFCAIFNFKCNSTSTRHNSGSLSLWSRNPFSPRCASFWRGHALLRKWYAISSLQLHFFPKLLRVFSRHLVLTSIGRDRAIKTSVLSTKRAREWDPLSSTDIICYSFTGKRNKQICIYISRLLPLPPTLLACWLGAAWLDGWLAGWVASQTGLPGQLARWT